MKEIDVRSCISREKEVKDGEKNLPERWIEKMDVLSDLRLIQARIIEWLEVMCFREMRSS